MYRAAKSLVVLGLAMRLLGRRAGPAGVRIHDLASVLYLAGGLAFRLAWVSAGKVSAADDAAVAAMARARRPTDDGASQATARRSGTLSTTHSPVRLPSVSRAWCEAVRRTSLAVERFLGRGGARPTSTG